MNMIIKHLGKFIKFNKKSIYFKKSDSDEYYPFLSLSTSEKSTLKEEYILPKLKILSYPTGDSEKSQGEYMSLNGSMVLGYLRGYISPTDKMLYDYFGDDYDDYLSKIEPQVNKYNLISFESEWGPYKKQSDINIPYLLYQSNDYDWNAGIKDGDRLTIEVKFRLLNPVPNENPNDFTVKKYTYSDSARVCLGLLCAKKNEQMTVSTYYNTATKLINFSYNRKTKTLEPSYISTPVADNKPISVSDGWVYLRYTYEYEKVWDFVEDIIPPEFGLVAGYQYDIGLSKYVKDYDDNDIHTLIEIGYFRVFKPDVQG